MKNLILFAFFAFFSTISALSAQDAGDKLIGLWEPSNGKVRIKIEKIANKYYGKIVWLREPNDPQTGQPKLDKNNPDQSMRSVPLKGYRMLKDFVYADGEWNNGTIYDPESGSTYSGVIKAKDDNTLDLRGYVGVKALGRTDVWKRIQVK